jgi:hypothetical protein
MKGAPGLFLLLLVVTQAGALDAPDVPMSQPWPGLSVLDAALCYRLVWESGWVEVRAPNTPMKVIWVHDVRGVRLPNGFWGLKINGQVLKLSTVWVEYGDQMVNLQILFTRGSAKVAPNLNEYRDPAP